MRYNEWNPTLHTVQDAPEVCLTHAWNAYYKANNSLPTRCDVGQDLFEAFTKNAEDQTEVRINVKPLLHFKTLKMRSTGKPGWDFAFSQETI